MILMATLFHGSQADRHAHTEAALRSAQDVWRMLEMAVSQPLEDVRNLVRNMKWRRLDPMFRVAGDVSGR